LNAEAAIAEVLDADGGSHTGDIGELTPRLPAITGRKKELIVAAGKNVAPAPPRPPPGHLLISQAVVAGDQRPFVAAMLAIDQRRSRSGPAS
jgi:long-chain acyl-CoA synthetase